ncbi:MAG: YchF family ATPase [Candidatus Pacebacteria bacterium]|nr:YchF family ATPase [Candidatus Paceibacterota bacterium]
MSLGIVGLPNVGKSTLFKLLTKIEVNIANYPFCTIDPNVGIVSVPDERLEKLAKMSQSKKTIPAVVEFFDIAGLVKGANKGEGLGNQFLSRIRETNAIVQVVRCFSNPDIVHIYATVDPKEDIETINTELILKDLETLEKRLEKAEKETKTGNKNFMAELNLLGKTKKFLTEGCLLVNVLEEEELKSPVIQGLNLLTTKKQIYLLNGKKEEISDEVIKKIEGMKGDYLIIDLESQTDLSDLIKKAYEVLDLISFFTTGEDETRAWTIKKGTKAPAAAGVIHSDFEKNFIKAEVINWEKLLLAGSWQSARQKGWLRLEGKDYEVKDGDVMVIKHNR